ncbi:unnamed protein product [Mytilus edulis]|uniref:Uncharacterized protein n=1 Tax=Mytilus edulis TaxID=6550 RepID=A0A8S3QTA1_MYTED|nr:unnamed protein product [Mytilus edulis]
MQKGKSEHIVISIYFLEAICCLFKGKVYELSLAERGRPEVKLITTDKAVEQMYLDVLQDYLFASFRMGGVGANTMLENKRLTIALRAFTDKHSLFKTGQTSKMDFWKSFQKAFLALDSAKWTFYEEKEIKKIEKANKTNEDYIVLILLKP